MVVCMMELAREMILLSTVLLYLANSVYPQACSDPDIRLVGGRNNSEGRVEVCYQGQWGTVCGDSWDFRDASVACRQLGLTSEYAIAVTDMRFGQGSGQIVLDEVNCAGTETNLQNECAHNGFGFHICDDSSDAGVICQQAAACNDTDIQLVGGRNELEGRVEFCHQGHWGTVCDFEWDIRNAEVVCQQLGLNTEYVGPINFDSGIFDLATGPIFLDDVGCTGNEARLLSCTTNEIGNAKCGHRNDAGVICLQDPVCNNTDIRLVEGRNNSELEGRVEVCYQGQWGTVCDDSWDFRDAIVACRQLGLNTENAVAINVNSGVFRRGTGPIFLDDVLCDGNEPNLNYCYHNRVSVHNCVHLEDAGVICPQQAECINGAVQLVDGISESNGRVEFCYRGIWGTVCDNSWDDNDATVVCRQLGYSTVGATATQFPHFGPGAVFIVVSDVNCFGVEANLTQCRYNASGIHNCVPSQAAGILCSGVSATIIGGTVGGTLILIILLLVVVIIIVAQRKKWCTDIIGSGRTSLKDDGSTKVGNLYSQQDPASLLHPQPRLHRVSSSYVRQLSEQLLISHHNIKLLKCIGQGEFGVVYKAQLTEKGTDPSFKAVAVKTLKGFFDQNEINKIMEESVKMKQFDHPNVMNLIGVCLNAGPAPYIVMPFMANGSLLSYLRKERSNLLLDETADEDSVLEVKKRLTVMCSQIASGMKYLTKERFIHRDLATRNCMLDAHFVIKIADFGLSEDVYARNYFRQGQGPSVKLPVKWMAPESLQDGIFSDKTDVWSFGVTCWEIFSGGMNPYPGVDPPAMVQLLKNGHRLSKPDNSACPEEIYSIMFKCWNSDPKERPSFSALVNFISGFAEKTAGYLDVSNYNPFEANITTDGANGDDPTEEKLDTNVGVLLDDPPVEMNVQCPSENESPHYDTPV